MKIYIYEHCPFCAKVTFFAGIKGIKLEEVVLLSDDETTPVSMTGKKELPILEKEDGSYLGESLDIIDYLDNLDGNPILQEESTDEVNKWLNEMFPILLRLFYPRITKIGLQEFATQSAADYFNNKKEPSIGSYSQALKDTSDLQTNANKLLSKLKDISEITEEKPFFNGKGIGFNDINVFGFIRCLTVAKDFNMPKEIDGYINGLSKKSGVELFTDKAI